jgi:hypothetical protein
MRKYSWHGDFDSYGMESFQNNWCKHCERDNAVWSCWDESAQRYTKEPEWEKSCEILSKTVQYKEEDEEYPTELRYCIDTPVCTAFKPSKVFTYDCGKHIACGNCIEFDLCLIKHEAEGGKGGKGK